MSKYVTLYNVPLYKKPELEEVCRKLELEFRVKSDIQKRLVFEIKMERDSEEYDVIVGIFKKKGNV